jgi:putative Mg2+ transporter-C (MgtC) family protein
VLIEEATISEAEAIIRIGFAAGSGALLGLDREQRDKPAGVRTFSMVAMGAALFSLVGFIAFGEDDVSARIAAPVVHDYRCLIHGL